MVCYKNKHKKWNTEKSDNIVKEVKNKTLHTKTVAKTPKDVLNNLL